MFIGIDPGLTGAVALYCPSASSLITADMPLGKKKNGKNKIDIYGLIELLRPSIQGSVFGTLEIQGPRPQEGRTSAYTSGRGYGALETALVAHRIPYQEVTPAKWKQYFRLSKDKGVSRSYVTQRFPQAADQFRRVMDHGRAEAALIAVYGAEVVWKEQVKAAGN